MGIYACKTASDFSPGPTIFHDPGFTAYILTLADLYFGNSLAVLQNDRFLERDDVVLLGLPNLTISLNMRRSVSFR
jgi:hypothetical protein